MADILFYWRSEALKQYGSGWLISAAPTVALARAEIRRAAPDRLAELRSWLSLDDPDDIEERDRFLAPIEKDLEPEPAQGSTLLILGSE